MVNSSHSGIFNTVVKSFGPTERAVFYCLATIMFLSGLSTAFEVNQLFLTEVPSYGGTFTEGVVGAPRFLNPLLAISETDKALVSLVYSGRPRPPQHTLA